MILCFISEANSNLDKKYLRAVHEQNCRNKDNSFCITSLIFIAQLIVFDFMRLSYFFNFFS